MNEILSINLKVQLPEATRRDHQPKDPARGTASAADYSRWQLAVRWFKSIAEQNISWQVTNK